MEKENMFFVTLNHITGGGVYIIITFTCGDSIDV